ncbi:MAG TPA: crossover junction endodeoxyribonuclease RuvC [Candidatus Acidoferrales bacterium]|nr:crossover junction endodeoxyribonuclease RuvC [Candidatus Acidoferrales bacterium]
MGAEPGGADTASRVPTKNGGGSQSERRTLRVLGVDPALAGATGYGVVECAGTSMTLLRFGALKFPARVAFGSRLREIHRAIAELVEEFSPNAIAVEAVFTALNMKTALRLAEVRGVILLAAAQASVPAFSYSPREVKASVAGYGGASKQQMQQMVGSLLRLSSIPEPADAADALAVALCHAYLSQARERMAAALGTGPGTSTGVRRNSGRAIRVTS